MSMENEDLKSEDEKYGLGSGWLGSHMNSSMMLEYNEIQKEFRRLKIKV